MDVQLHEAILYYGDNGQFRIVQPGSYVTCVMTGQRIPLENLRYWSVARQEPYANAAAAAKREDGA